MVFERFTILSFSSSSEAGRETGVFGRDEESGYVILFLAFSFMAILALLGVAIDSGNLFRARVVANNATSSAAIAGANLIATRKGDATDADRLAKNLIRANLANNGYEISPALSIQTNFNPVAGNSPPSFEVEMKDFQVRSMFLRFAPIAVDILNVSSESSALIKSGVIQLVLDVSDSMSCAANPPDPLDPCNCGGGQGSCTAAQSKLRALKDAINDVFLPEFDETLDRIGVVSFNTGARIDGALSANPGYSVNALRGIVNGLQPAAATNPCDGLRKAYEEVKRIGATGSAAYVLFTDGAPNAAIMNYASRNGLGGGEFYYWAVNATNCPIYQLPPDPSDPQAPPGFKSFTSVIPSAFGAAPSNPLAASPYYGKLDPGTNVAGCSNLQCRVVMSGCGENDTACLQRFGDCPAADQACRDPFNGRHLRHQACLNDVSFNAPDVITTWTTPASKYAGNFEWRPDFGDAGRWREPFYDCAIAMADTIRDSGGSVFVVALGAPADDTVADPYQDVRNVQFIKQFFLRRIANDRCGENDPQFPGLLSYSDMTDLGFREGTVLFTPTGDELKDLFGVIAQSIKLQLGS